MKIMDEEEIIEIPENDPIEMFFGFDSEPVSKERDPISQMPDSASLVYEGDSNQVNDKINDKITESKNVHARRNSTGEIGIPYRSIKILSRYLATTSSSCHDHCKYGTRQDLDTKTPESPTLKRIVEKPSKSHDVGKTLALGERKKKLTINPISPPGSKILRPDIPVTPRKQVSPSTNKQVSPSTKKQSFLKQLSLPLNGISPKSRPELSRTSSIPIKEHSISKEHGDDIQEKKVSAGMNSSGASGSRKKTSKRNIKEVKSSNMKGKKVLSRTNSLSALHSVKKVLARPIVSLAPKRSGKKVSSSKTERIKNLNVVSGQKDHTEVPKAESPRTSIEDIPERTLHVIEPNEENTSARPQQNNDSTVQLSPTGKIPRRSQHGHVSRSSLASPKSTHSGNLAHHHETNIEKKSLNSKSLSKNRPVKDGVVSTKDKDSPARKLSFREGKVLENHSVASPSKRLIFKKRSLSDSLVVDVERIESNLKKEEVEVENVETDDEESEKVVLKHQDVEEKKGAQSLLNNMIEETANKLAETKKSKVKVLVGAFESVISLQDSGSVSTVDAH